MCCDFFKINFLLLDIQIVSVDSIREREEILVSALPKYHL